MTVPEALVWGRSRLIHSPSAQLDAEILLAHVCGVDRFYLCTVHAVLPCHFDLFQHAIFRRSQGEPVAYITGLKDFFAHTFSVNASTLIPRPETEQLLEAAIAYLDPHPNLTRVLDVGTGSGVLIISILAHFPNRNWKTLGVDIHPDALLLAKQNGERLLTPSARGCLAFAREMPADGAVWDVLLCNPPYGTFADWCRTTKEVHIYEPEGAVVQDRPLSGWLGLLKGYLRPGGYLFLEWGAWDDCILHPEPFGFRTVQWWQWAAACHGMMMERQTDGCI